MDSIVWPDYEQPSLAIMQSVKCYNGKVVLYWIQWDMILYLEPGSNLVISISLSLAFLKCSAEVRCGVPSSNNLWYSHTQLGIGLAY